MSDAPDNACYQHLEMLCQYPFPLRPQMNVHLRLPTDLTKAEAERIVAYVRSLA